MNPEQKMVTVFRSADSSAEDDAAAAADLLTSAGLNPVILSDKEPDVLMGSVEVRVPAAEEAEADRILNAARNEEPVEGDASHSLDLETVFERVGTTAEMEALAVRSVLDAAGVASVLVGSSAIPNFPFTVKVPRSSIDQARTAIEEARSAGPAGAEEAEQATEPR
jgi:hypothetical protein